MRVLLVEDDRGDAEQIRGYLAAGPAAPFDVEVAVTLEEAMGRVAAAGYDAVLLDLAIGGRRDLSALEAVRREAAATPVVVLTGLEDEALALKAMQEGAQDFLAKRHANTRMLSRTLRYAVERNRTRLALEESEARFRRLAANAPDLIYRIRVHPDFAFEYLSPATATITGYTPEEFYADPGLGRTIIHVDDQHHLANLAAGRPRLGEATEMRWRHKDGRLVWVQLRSVPIHDVAGRLVAIEGAARDVTAQHLDQERLHAMEEQLTLVQRLEAIGRLAGGVAHDFNNILTTVLGYSELLLDRLPESDPSRKILEEIHKAGERATGLTRQLLAFSRKQMLQPKVLNLNTVITDVHNLIRQLIGEDITITLRLDPDLGPVLADPGQVEQVLVNLAVNARDAMREGGTLTIETSNVVLDEDYAAAHVSAKAGAYALLRVMDTGVGMEPETQAHIFEPFFTTKEKGKGTGLGLATVYGIVKQSNGNIWVYSEPGIGSVFKVYLPRVTAAGEPEPAPAPPPPARTGHETILLAEDEEGVRLLAKDVLTTAGYTLLVAANGEEAVEAARRHEGPIDLVLTDVVMPRLGGREAADRIALHRPGTRILFMSGYTEDAVIRHGVIDAGVEFMEKPFTPARLRGRVREVLDQPAKTPSATRL